MKSAWIAVSLDVANKTLTLIAADKDREACQVKMEQRATTGRLFNITAKEGIRTTD